MKQLECIKKHNLFFEGPAPNFFEGALMGNGGLGVVVTTRPDALCLHLGHNNIWDIRVTEEHEDEIGTFKEVFERFSKEGAESEWYNQYLDLTGANYRSKYPRPFPCGTLIMFYDRRDVEVLNYDLDISTGVLTIQYLVQSKCYDVKVVIHPTKDYVHIQVPQVEETETGIFNKIQYIPETDSSVGLPKYEEIDHTDQYLRFSQRMPFSTAKDEDGEAVHHPKDKMFAIQLGWNRLLQKQEGTWCNNNQSNDALEVFIQLEEGLKLEHPEKKFLEKNMPFEEVYNASVVEWERYWSCSGIELSDAFLERTWYRNQYFIKCTTHGEKNCPGLFGNWMKGNIGTAWHSDYHFNYNIQQPFWGMLASNHPDTHLAYVRLVEDMLPISQKWAKEYYGLRGAFFPHTGYPVEMHMMPYPVPHWGWEVCETPWAVQGLWWHYEYTQDIDLLRERLFEPIKEASLFLIDYMMRPEAHGEAWGDKAYHIFPTVVPELYGLTTNFEKNKDCIIDLTLTKFLFKAFAKACKDLEVEDVYNDDLQKCQHILNHFPSYPTAISKRGEVFTTIEGEDPEVIQNVPVTPTPVFPGEDIGIDSDEESYKVAVQTWYNHRNEGGNELVFYNLQGARLGVLDLERFKRQIKYCLLPNGTCTDRVLVTGGRYWAMTDFDFMSAMGIWVENMGLTAVINECLLQGYNGTVHMFPNWPLEQSASFRDLRVKGAFLISSECGDGEVKWIKVYSEKGGTIQIKNPWKQGEVIIKTLQPKESILLENK